MSAIAVVGAGLAGRLIAWKLLQRGETVTLFDRGSRHGELSAARVAAAMLAPYSEVASADRAVFDWGLEALQWWPAQLAQLSAHSGIHVHCAIDGSVVVAHEQDRATLTHFLQQLRARIPEYATRVESCDAARLQALEPELGTRFHSAVYLPDEGYLDNSALLSALEIAISTLGGDWREHCAVSRVEPNTVVLEGQSEAFDLVIDSRGLGAKSQLPSLRGVRGEVLWLHAPEVALTRPVRLMHPRYKLYVAPRPNRRYVIGATEIESDSMAAISVRSSLELQSALYSLHSGFAEATVEHAYAHCRPALPDNMPMVRFESGLMQVNGLYRHGYLLGPHVVEHALQTLDGVSTNRRVSA